MKTIEFNYKGFDITFGLYGMDDYTVQYCGDDLFFESLEEAKEFIDGIA